MPILTRRRDPHRPECCGGDVHVGTISKAVGNPNASPQWQWSCGFYPGSNPGDCSTGKAESFDQARSEFMTAWVEFLSKRTEADFDEWREQQDWTARKYAAWARGEKVPDEQVKESLRKVAQNYDELVQRAERISAPSKTPQSKSPQRSQPQGLARFLHAHLGKSGTRGRRP